MVCQQNCLCLLEPNLYARTVVDAQGIIFARWMLYTVKGLISFFRPCFASVAEPNIGANPSVTMRRPTEMARSEGPESEARRAKMGEVLGGMFPSPAEEVWRARFRTFYKLTKTLFLVWI